MSWRDDIIRLLKKEDLRRLEILEKLGTTPGKSAVYAVISRMIRRGECKEILEEDKLKTRGLKIRLIPPKCH